MNQTSPDVVAKIEKLRMAGYTIRRIASELRVSINVAKKYCSKISKRPGMAEELKRELWVRGCWRKRPAYR